MPLSSHWNRVYATRDPRRVSWFQRHPVTSLERIQAVTAPDDPVIDVGAGASLLADHLLDAGFTDLTLLDVSSAALALVRHRLGPDPRIHYVAADIRTWTPPRPFATWHDRAVFHFLTDEADRAAYRTVLHASLPPGGHAIVSTFALDGPDRCSDLPTARYDADGLHAALGTDAFDLVDAETEIHLRPDGREQAFQAVVLRRRA